MGTKCVHTFGFLFDPRSFQLLTRYQEVSWIQNVERPWGDVLIFWLFLWYEQGLQSRNDLPKFIQSKVYNQAVYSPYEFCHKHLSAHRGQ